MQSSRCQLQTHHGNIFYFFYGFINTNFAEDTYCRQDTVVSQPLMVWVMDTVDGSGRDAMRYLSWADIYIVVRSVFAFRLEGRVV